jgi:predicted N-acyltransferase
MDPDYEDYEAWLEQLQNEERRQIEHNEYQEQLNGICINQG